MHVGMTTFFQNIDHALSDAASAAGFADQAHMTRSFRRMMGVTPGAYRDAYRRAG